MSRAEDPPQRRIAWERAYRIVPSRFPPVGPWDRIASPEDFEALAEIEALTNPRIREELGTLSLTPRDRWLTGPGSTPVMAAFTHLQPGGSRFTDGSFGVFYASREIETALRENVHHRTRFLAATREPPTQVQMRAYRTRIACRVHDVRGGWPRIHDPDDYSASQRLAVRLRAANSNGIVYDSVRNPGGQCVAMFWPDRVGPCTQAAHFAFVWDGERITDVIELKAVKLPKGAG
jgi:hypothetical protein